MLANGVTTIGEVPRTTDFEKAEKNRYTVIDGHFVADPLRDDMALAVNIEGHGIVVITGCSHSGVINIIRRSLELFPDASLEGVIGGFHLKKADPERIEKTAEALEELHPRWVAAGHCTGFNAQVAFRNRFGKDFQPLFTGKTLTVPRE